MLPYGTEVGSVPRFAVDQEAAAAAATSRPRLISLHVEEEEEVPVLSARSPTLLNTSFALYRSRSSCRPPGYRFSIPIRWYSLSFQYTISDNDIQYCSNIPIIQCYTI